MFMYNFYHFYLKILNDKIFTEIVYLLISFVKHLKHLMYLLTYFGILWYDLSGNSRRDSLKYVTCQLMHSIFGFFDLNTIYV